MHLTEFVLDVQYAVPYRDHDGEWHAVACEDALDAAECHAGLYEEGYETEEPTTGLMLALYCECGEYIPLVGRDVKKISLN